MKARNFWHAVVVMLGLAAFAAASPISVSMTGSGANGTPMGGPASTGVYYYPYYLVLPDGSTIAVACDDYYGQSPNFNRSFQVNVNTFSTLSQAMFGGQRNSLQKYEEVAWLFDQFDPVTSSSGNDLTDAAINYAMWDIMDSHAPSYNGNSKTYDWHPWHNNQNNSNPEYTSSYWENLAENTNFSGYDFSDFVIYTPLDCNYQELIGKIVPPPTSPVPEPATVWMWIGGLGVLGLVAYKRRTREAVDPA